MKNFSLVLLALILTLTFTASDTTGEKGNKPDKAQKCPYLEQLQQNHSQAECPYLNKTEEGQTGCPYLEGSTDTQSECPYLYGGSCGECPYLQQQGEKVMKKIIYYPLPEGKNS
jgi:hypothetical protein